MTININYLKTRAVRNSLVILASGSALIITGLNAELNKSEWAYWVQAIGSIAAILGAFFLGERQSNRALATALELSTIEEKKRLASIFSICTVAQQRANLISRIFCADEFKAGIASIEYDDSLIEGIIRALSNIPIHELGSAEAVLAIMEMTDQFRFLPPCIDKVRLGPSMPPSKQKSYMIIHQLNVQIHTNSIWEQYKILQATIGGSE